MNDFWSRMITVVAIGVLICIHDKTIETRDREEQIAELSAQLELVQIAEAAGMYTDGTYSGTATGFGGDITVAVSIENGNIESVSVTSAKDEDEEYLIMAKQVIDSIIDEQSTEVDTVTGATFTSTGIIDATAAALEQA